MEIPQVLFHGTFLPEGASLLTSGLRPSYPRGYVSTTALRHWADFWAVERRYDKRGVPGLLVVYQINTGIFPKEIIDSCIPPGELDPRSGEDELLGATERMLREERADEGLEI